MEHVITMTMMMMVGRVMLVVVVKVVMGRVG